MLYYYADGHAKEFSAFYIGAKRGGSLREVMLDEDDDDLKFLTVVSLVYHFCITVVSRVYH
eukprot:8822446-Heterocapsa_arctica.AAC.1